MILSELFKENNLIISDKGMCAIGKAVRNVYPHMDMWFTHDEDGEYLAKKIIDIELPDEDCLKILQLTVRYVSLWAFA